MNRPRRQPILLSVSHKKKGQLGSRERSRLPAARTSLAFWLLLLILSTLLMVGIKSINLLIDWLIPTGATFILLGIYKINRFRSKEGNLLSTGQCLSQYSYKAQTRKLIFVFFATVICFLLPLFLSSLLGTLIWIGIILGVIDGWIASLVFYNLYLRSWERANHGKLYQIQLWMGSRVGSTGISFERESN